MLVNIRLFMVARSKTAWCMRPLIEIVYWLLCRCAGFRPEVPYRRRDAHGLLELDDRGAGCSAELACFVAHRAGAGGRHNVAVRVEINLQGFDVRAAHAELEVAGKGAYRSAGACLAVQYGPNARQSRRIGVKG